jgi:acetolactate synthase-1/2/3 large subunit/5-guanidino-2-oxopentanoate decarboxylase
VAKNPDFGLLAAAYGVGYSRPASIAAFQTALGAALTADGPTILHLTPAVTSSS